MLKVKTIFKNDYVFSVTVKILMVLVGIFHSAFLARFLGAELKGLAATVTSTVSIAQIFITFGINQAYPYYKRENKIEQFREKFITNLYLIFFVYFAVMIGLSTYLYHKVSDATVFSIILTPLFGYEMVIGYIHLIECPKKRNMVTLVSSILETVILLFMWLFIKVNPFWMLVGISISIFLRSVFSTIGVRTGFKKEFVSIKFIFKMYRFGFLPMAALFLTALNSKVDILMLSAVDSVTRVDIGIYSVGIGLAERILYIPDAVREILLSKLVKGSGENEVARVTRLCFAVSLVIAVFVIAFGQAVIYILYGTEYMNSYPVAIIASLGVSFMVFLKMISQYNIVHKRQFANLALLSISVIVNIICNIIFVPKFGIYGAAWSAFIGHFLCGVAFSIYFKLKTGIPFKNLILINKDDLSLLKRK